MLMAKASADEEAVEASEAVREVVDRLAARKVRGRSADRRVTVVRTTTAAITWANRK